MRLFEWWRFAYNESVGVLLCNFLLSFGVILVTFLGIATTTRKNLKNEFYLNKPLVQWSEKLNWSTVKETLKTLKGPSINDITTLVWRDVNSSLVLLHCNKSSCLYSIFLKLSFVRIFTLICYCINMPLNHDIQKS